MRFERVRLGYKQEEFGILGGVNRNTQGSYERGDRNPDTIYLASIARIGVDVAYVITGSRALPHESTLSDPEKDVLNYLRSMSEENKLSLRRVAFALSVADNAAESH